MKNQVAVSANLVTAGPEAFNPKEEPTEPEDQLALLIEQLGNFTDQDDGSISGKHAGNEDDAGMALLLASSWSVKVKAAAAESRRKDPHGPY